jgi:uncharacterized protein YbaR (Trm112 family)
MKNIINKIKIEWYYFKYVFKFKQKYKNKLELVSYRFPIPETNEEIIAFDRFCNKYYPLEDIIPKKLPDWLMTAAVDTETVDNNQNENPPHYLTNEQENILQRILNDEKFVYATDKCFNDIEQWLRLQNRPDDADKVLQMSEKIYYLNGEEKLYYLNEEKARRIKNLFNQ